MFQNWFFYLHHDNISLNHVHQSSTIQLFSPQILSIFRKLKKKIVKLNIRKVNPQISQCWQIYIHVDMDIREIWWRLLSLYVLVM